MVSFTMDVLNSTGSVGATLTTISSTDNLSNFPTTYNANLSELNNSKFELSNWFATTTATQITDLGTITTGTWNADILGVAFGGTGSSTPTGLLYGDGSGSLNTIPYGTSGQFLQSQGAGSAPTYTTASIDEALDYDWTGLHTFSGGLLSTASSTFSSNVQFDGATTFTNTLDLTSATVSGVAQVASSTTYTSSGTYTKSTGAKKVLVEIWGAGGSGGSGENPSVGGGGGGEYRKYWLDASDLDASVSITIGSGGAGVTASSETSGNSGGDTTFGGYATSTGGSGGGYDSANNNPVAGGSGGTPFSNIEGIWGAGQSSAGGQSGTKSAGGGGSESGGGNGGGSSLWGGAGGGGSGNASQGAGGTSTYGGNGGDGEHDTEGGDGVQPGGGGGACDSSTGTHESGTGGDGQVIITEFF